MERSHPLRPIVRQGNTIASIHLELGAPGVERPDLETRGEDKAVDLVVDTIEFICRLQAPNYAPGTLLGELESNHLLILGCGFADWLDRFFLRTTKRRKLSDPRDVREIVADQQTSKDRNLALFLENFSRKTHIFNGASADFVAELWRRWQIRHANPDRQAQANDRQAAPDTEMPTQAIFISYNHQDIEAVKQLYSGLTAAGLPVWFDRSAMKPGDEFSRVIERNIERCQLFIPVISANTEARGEGWFRKEWKLATERQDMKAEDEAFILPVVIDDVAEPGKRVPSLFSRLHWSRLRNGNVTPEFSSRVLELWKNG
ncbi:MAG: toll/interleukin-1 receptor domain-containing protein [Deltaproteobacteria bacterium]|nr:toll/interleukin-1 receptor domain-containing protein [Deltaproteobacteria bacterium]